MSSISKSLKHINLKKKKKTSHIVKHEKFKIRNKTEKLGKQSGTTYCFGCKDYTQNFRPEKMKITIKVCREKSHCVVCQSTK